MEQPEIDVLGEMVRRGQRSSEAQTFLTAIIDRRIAAWVESQKRLTASEAQGDRMEAVDARFIEAIDDRTREMARHYFLTMMRGQVAVEAGRYLAGLKAPWFVRWWLWWQEWRHDWEFFDRRNRRRVAAGQEPQEED